jgi:ATP-dependent DNA helicase Q1
MSESSYLRKQTLNNQLNKIEGEISDVEQDIRTFQALRSDLLRKKVEIQKQLGEVQPTRTETADRKGKGKARNDGIDYTREFDWSNELKARMKKVFGIDSFRLCQQGCVLLFLLSSLVQRVTEFVMQTWTVEILSA